MTGCCSSGFMPWPLDHDWPGGSGANGFEMNATIAPKKTTLIIITATTHGISARFRRRFCRTTMKLIRPSMKVHRSSDPACPPQSAALNQTGCSRAEICATNARSKRSPISAASSPMNASTSSANTAITPRSALTTRAGLPRRPPITAQTSA